MIVQLFSKALEYVDGGHATAYQLAISGRGSAKCQTCSTTPLTHKASPADVARITAAVASDFRVTYFGTGAFAVRLLRDQKLMYGIPKNPRRLSNVLNTKPELLREFCGHLTKPGDETVTLFADGPGG
jgi:hypothetical protein